MPWFPLRAVQTEYELTPGNRFTTFRHSLHVQIGGSNWLDPYCFFDTGAPFSIISQSVAQQIGAMLTPIPVQFGPIPTFER
ncbi:MAG: retroviral-like aspartic protease family protein [Planctomycetia bacterium]|nr:retroviral-like aspartic protease family protein [Planctomycetia bacterium]